MSVPVRGAGGVVFDSKGNVLLIRYPSGGWSFPKGHLEAGEDDPAAALREVEEETGVRAEIVADAGETEYVNAQGVLRRVRWFAMRAAGGQERLEDTFSDGGFYRLQQARELLSYEEDRNLLERALHALEIRAQGES
ncbi:diadenosine hexaphosphate hydrolase (ATP-forming) [Deinobacterium chartae]|uniref:Diadenosine hexaphosphate hydrolase (ATP-forming) n=1 Tax=Deinobacterium chartae TaxID=521158 RepID=A0A841I2M9_9DEIO|nr:NUDIX hydrolase [Deinobacterium chartae]MBB6100071.1 diadenosine hexaphosphate hydrolase (ATP-forming) [Deinobacterium chartae]